MSHDEVVRWRAGIAMVIAAVLLGACADPEPVRALRALELPAGALSDPGSVGIARFLVAADGSVDVKAGQSIPVRPLESAATGRSLTLNTAKGAFAYAIAVSGTIHVIVSGGKPHAYHPGEPITIGVPAGRATTVAVLDSLSQPISTANDWSLSHNDGENLMDFDAGKLSGPGPPGLQTDVVRDNSLMSSGFAAVNGARIVEWQDEGTPTLADCVAVPPDRWVTTTGWWDPSGVYCVQTSEGRFVLLRIFVDVIVDGSVSACYGLWRTSPATGGHG